MVLGGAHGAACSAGSAPAMTQEGKPDGGELGAGQPHAPEYLEAPWEGA